MGVEQVTGPVVYHGEGPVWYPGWGGLRFVDMLAGDIMSLALDGYLERRHVGSVARGGQATPKRWSRDRCGTRLRLRGRRRDLDSAAGVVVRPRCTDERGRAATPTAAFTVGPMAYDQSVGAASLHRLDPDGSVEVVLDQVKVSNGLDWSPDGALVYNDTATCTISVFDYDTAAGLTNRRTFAELPDGGRPDGLTVDASGGTWAAVSNRGAVYRYSVDGVLEEKLPVPARKVTACTFGGEELDQLFITTSQENIDTSEEASRVSLPLQRRPQRPSGPPLRRLSPVCHRRCAARPHHPYHDQLASGLTCCALPPDVVNWLPSCSSAVSPSNCAADAAFCAVVRWGALDTG